MSGEKRPRRTAAEIRRGAYVEVMDWLEYRIAVCREGLERAEASTGPTRRGAATERAATFEAELIQKEIARLANQQPRSRAFKAAAAERATYLTARKARARPTTPTNTDTATKGPRS